MKYAEEIFKSRNPHFSSYEDTESLSVSAKGVILKDSVSLLLQEYQRKQNGNCSMTYKKTEHIISMTRMNRKNFFSVCFSYFSLWLAFLRIVVTPELPIGMSGRRLDFTVLYYVDLERRKCMRNWKDVEVA